jgi:hypothetical protein
MDWLALGYATVFGSAIAYGLFFYFASSGNLTSLSSLTFLTPIFALIFGYIFLDEILTSIQWLGVFLTLISIYLINQRETFNQKNQTIIINQPNTTSEPILEASANQDLPTLTLPVGKSQEPIVLNPSVDDHSQLSLNHPQTQELQISPELLPLEQTSL